MGSFVSTSVNLTNQFNGNLRGDHIHAGVAGNLQDNQGLQL